MRSLKEYAFDLPEGVVCLRDEDVHYIIDGKPLVHREFVASGKKPCEVDDYIVMRYRAMDLQRFPMLRQPILIGVRGDMEVPLICANEMFTDGREHRVIAHCAKQSFDFLRLRLRSRAPHVELTILELYTCSKEELPKRFNESDYNIDGYKCIDIKELCNSHMEEAGAIDGGVGFPEGIIGLSSIPFVFAGGVIRPSAPPKENDEEIKNFNTRALRRHCRPESRESRFTVPVNDTAREVYFVLAMDGKMHERWGFCAPDPTILGSSQGEVMMPLRVNDIERLAVLVEYADGTVDECFPENLVTHRHEVEGEVGLYGVRAKENVAIASLGFEDRMLDTDVSLCALTLNKTREYRLQERFAHRVHTAKRRFDARPCAIYEGNDLVLQNGAFYARIDTEGGFILKEIRSAFSETFSCGGALLKVREGENILERFERIARTERSVTYRYGAVDITVTFDLDVADGVRWQASAVNHGEAVSFGLIFPALSDVHFASSEDTWYFLPKYQNTESNGTCYVYEESAPSFPMQFFDIFSPSEGCGMAVNTYERDLKVRKYALSKQQGVTNAFIEYPSMYLKLSHEATFRTSETTTVLHEGDWHTAYRRYRAWVNTWYEPYKCQNKKWYREKFWLIAEIRDFIERRDIMKFPVWYDEATGGYNYQRIMDEVTEIYGETPDILHMWAWTWSSEKNHMLWGNFGQSDYDRIGGLDNFRKAMQEVSKNTGAEISLYMHPTLLSEDYPQSKDYFPTLRSVNAAGNFIPCLKDSFRMCHANKTWRDYALSMYPRVHKETGVRLLYVDEFSLRVDNRCYADGHGHEVPSNLLKTDRQFISELKDMMPEDVVLYGEYYAVDLNARYIDCNISYYILDAINAMIEQGVHSEDASDIYGTVLTDIYRFVFPKIVQLILPMAMRNKTWQPLKATFFNGEAIYDSFWDTEESRGRRFMAKSFHIKKTYADCFSSDEPETMIDGPEEAVCINRYPGEGRCMYTLYNRAYHTFEGEVLAVPYMEGARFYDVWNDCDAPFEVRDGVAYVKARVSAQNVGAIVELY